MKCLKCYGTGRECDNGSDCDKIDFKNDKSMCVEYCGNSCDRCDGTGKVEFYIEQELKDRCTPDIIKRMVELAEGFSIEGEWVISFDNIKINLVTEDVFAFSTLIHRSIEGWNNIYYEPRIVVLSDVILKDSRGVLTNYEFHNYQPQSLTACECACLHCLIDIFKEERE